MQIEKVHDGYKIIRKLPNNLREEDNYLFNKDIERSFLDLNCLYYKNVLINENEYLWKGFTFLKETFFKREYRREESLCNNLKFFIKSIFIKKEEVTHAIWLIDAWSNNYFHWFGDALHRYFILRDKYPGFTLLLPAKYSKIRYVIESLALLSIKHKFISTGKIFRIKNLISAPDIIESGNYVENAVRKLQSEFWKKVQYHEGKLGENIYISRKNAVKRKVVNEEEIIDLLRKNDFKIYDFDQVVWKDQIAICRNAATIISINGAALTNMIFMQPNSNVVEFRHPAGIEQNCFFSLASALNINYYYIKSQPNQGNHNFHDADLIIPIKKLEQLLNLI